MKPIDYAIAGLWVASKIVPKEEEQTKLLKHLLKPEEVKVITEYPEPKTFREKLAKWIRGY